MKTRTIRTLRHLIYIILLILLDQFTKYLAIINLKGSEAIKLIPNILHMQYLENDGAVFGVFSGNVAFLTIFSVAIIILIIYFYLRLPDDKRYNIMRILLVFVIAGAFGNFIDRIRLNYVVDFIYFVLIDFPIFNLADIYVTVATLLFILFGWLYYTDEDFEFLENKREQ